MWILQTVGHGCFLEWTQFEENIPDIFTYNQHFAANLVAQHINYFPLKFLESRKSKGGNDIPKSKAKAIEVKNFWQIERNDEAVTF